MCPTMTGDVVFAPLFTPGLTTCAPVSQIDPSSNGTAIKAYVPNNKCVRLADKQLLSGTAPTPGAYAITLLERDTASASWSGWAIPNELAPFSPDGQSKLLLVK